MCAGIILFLFIDVQTKSQNGKKFLLWLPSELVTMVELKLRTAETQFYACSATSEFSNMWFTDNLNQNCQVYFLDG